jgi:hypothetical protein
MSCTSASLDRSACMVNNKKERLGKFETRSIEGMFCWLRGWLSLF